MAWAFCSLVSHSSGLTFLTLRKQPEVTGLEQDLLECILEVFFLRKSPHLQLRSFLYVLSLKTLVKGNGKLYISVAFINLFPLQQYAVKPVIWLFLNSRVLLWYLQQSRGPFQWLITTISQHTTTPLHILILKILPQLAFKWWLQVIFHFVPR